MTRGKPVEVDPNAARTARNRVWIGPAMAAGASVVIGLSVVGTRFVVIPPRAADPLAIALIRNIVGLSCMAALLPALHLGKSEPHAPTLGANARRDGLALVLLGLLGFCLYPLLFTAALRYAEAAQAALALPAIPLLTLLLGAALGRERLTMPKLIGVILAGVGVCGANGVDASSLPGALLAGGALMLGAATSSAAYNVLAPPLVVRLGSATVVLVSTAAGTIALALMALPVLLVRPLALDAAGWVVVALVGAASGGANLLWAAALRLTPPSSVAIFTTLIPVVAALSAAVLLDEPVTASLLVAFALVATGILIVNLPTPARSSRAPPQR